MKLFLRSQRNLAATHEPTYASGAEADQVGEQLAGVQRAFDTAYSLNGGARMELINSFLDAREKDWDGYDALPVPNGAFERAEHFLRRCMAQFPAPLCGASPAGSLIFEWNTAPDRRFMVSVSEDAHVAFAGVYGEDSKHGTAVFVRDLPSDIVDGLRRLYPE